MSISDKINSAKKSLEEVKKNKRYKKQNLEREERAKLVADSARCIGQMEVCKRTFDSTIHEQSRNIMEGRERGCDTLTQEQIMWDAAIGYLLVDDAIYALKTVTTYDSLERAYDMMEVASKQLAGKGSKLSNFKGGKKLEKALFSYLNSNELLDRKGEILNGFFEELKQTGDIQACLNHKKNTNTSQAADAYIDPLETQTTRTGGVRSASMYDDLLGGDDSDMGNIAFDQSTLGNSRPPQ